MARLPMPGSDDGKWGQVLNDYLSVEHNNDGSLKLSGTISSKYTKPAGGIPKTDLSSSVQASLTAIDNAVTSVAGKTGTVMLTSADVGLGNVNDTSDSNKPVSVAQQVALDKKANKSEAVALAIAL